MTKSLPPAGRCPRVLCQLGCDRRRDSVPGGWSQRCQPPLPLWKSTGTIGREPLPRISSPLWPGGKQIWGMAWNSINISGDWWRYFKVWVECKSQSIFVFQPNSKPFLIGKVFFLIFMDYVSKKPDKYCWIINLFHSATQLKGFSPNYFLNPVVNRMSL